MRVCMPLHAGQYEGAHVQFSNHTQTPACTKHRRGACAKVHKHAAARCCTCTFRHAGHAGTSSNLDGQKASQT
eukprot:2777600-Pleurochrysis_carterae.AAC.1